MGKTKDVILNNDGTCTLKFKDDATGRDGVFDPGENQVALKIDGLGKASMVLSQHFFKILNENKIPTHFIDWDLNAGTMLVKVLKIFPVEFIWRDVAWGSFCRAYGVRPGFKLGGLVEATYKSDELGDPRISKETLVALGIITAEQFDKCVEYVKKVGEILKQELSKYDFELYDFKLEFGLDEDNNIILGDEISGGIWRVFKDGEPVHPIDCAKIICPEYY